MGWKHLLLIGVACGLSPALAATAQSTGTAVSANAQQSLSLQVARARLHQDEAGDGEVLDLELAPASVQAFAQFTSMHVGRRIALLADGTPLASPTLMSPITDGLLRITPGVGDYALAPAQFQAIAARLAAPEAVIQARLLPIAP